jgi:hypothetical protein
MKRTKQEKKARGGQPGNQNARKHGRYSTVISPRELEVIEAVKSLDDHGSRLIFAALCYQFLPHEFLPDAPSPKPPAPPRQPAVTPAALLSADPELSRHVRAWAAEHNLDFDEYVRGI